MSQSIPVPPINQVFRFLQQKTRVQMWLVDRPNVKIEGFIRGFDEYMNVVLDDAIEVRKKDIIPLGRILLKGDNITIIRGMSDAVMAT